MKNKDFQNGLIVGMVSGGVVEVEVPAKEEQEKTVTITENGTTEILPDENKALSKVTVVTDIEAGGNGNETAVEYIESTGTQYIDTGMCFNQDYRVELKFREIGQIDNYPVVMGARTDNIVNSFCIGLAREQKYLFFQYGNNAEYMARGYGSFLIGDNILTVDKNICTISNGSETVTLTNNYNNYTTEYPVYLFGLNQAGVLAEAVKIAMRLYYCKIWENENLLRDLVPAIDENGVVCLYDKVTEAYFYNQGSGEFKGSFIEKGLAEVETLIDESGVLDSTEGTVTEKVEQLIIKAKAHSDSV